MLEFSVIPQAFYNQPTLQLAEQLIGKMLIKHTEEGTAAGYIVETEAYMGPIDRAAHSYNNRRTARTEIMFSEAGHVYTYTMHTHCLVNVVSGEVDVPEAILIRAVEPCYGIELMRLRRGTDKKDKDLTNGPGKLCRALGITMNDYGGRMTDGPLYIAEGKQYDCIETSPRIGIDNTGEAKDYPWRFSVQGNPFVSKR